MKSGEYPHFKIAGLRFVKTRSSLWLFVGSHDWEFYFWGLRHYRSFNCKCGRRQLAKIGPKCAEKVGWRRINNHWVCPFCCGNEGVLMAIFDGAKKE
jgi:hypothetical protein